MNWLGPSRCHFAQYTRKGDAQGWYESGACEDLVIRKNRFRDCQTSVFQYCDALVSIHPEVKDLGSQRRRYHRNILIEDNDIETFDVPLLFALSAENVTWRNNRVKHHDRYRGWGRKPFEAKGCVNVVVDGVKHHTPPHNFLTFQPASLLHFSAALREYSTDDFRLNR